MGFEFVLLGFELFLRILTTPLGGEGGAEGRRGDPVRAYQYYFIKNKNNNNNKKNNHNNNNHNHKNNNKNNNNNSSNNNTGNKGGDLGLKNHGSRFGLRGLRLTL